MRRPGPLVPVLRCAASIVATLAPLSAQDTDLEFFEDEVRPLLAGSCHRCHGPEKQKSGLRLDHGTFVRRGGERGPALVPGDPGTSRMIRAVRYGDPDLQMPPKSRLSPAQVATLVEWVRRGAPWPDEPVPTGAGGEEEFDLPARRAAHWCWQPVRPPQPPRVTAPGWHDHPVDAFVRRRLDAAGLEPVPLADRPTLLRRVTFDLTGLPPTPAELDAFLADRDEGAWERVVDRLLASPRFGERWARHWLDLARYAESLGHEYDFDIHGAWRYRDYLIRAFNADVPYDRLLREHVAGDLLPEEETRHDPRTGLAESVVGTAFWWLGEQTHSPVDTRQHFADRVDNQIDTFGKTFLGLTVGCARCHDHKFDAFSQKDYYALAGYLKSSRFVPAGLVPEERIAPVAAALDTAGAEIVARWTDLARLQLDGLEGRLRQLAARGLPDGEAIAADPDHPLHGLVLARSGTDALEGTWRGARAAPGAGGGPDAGRTVHDFRRDGARGWFREGIAFRSGAPGAWYASDGTAGRVRFLAGGWTHSGRSSGRLHGILHSPDFTLDRRWLHVLACGEESRINLVVEGFNVIRDPIYGACKQLIEDPRPRWYTIDLGLWQGLDAYVTLTDAVMADPADDHRPEGYGPDGWLAVQRIVLSDDEHPPPVRPDPLAHLVAHGEGPLRGLGDLLARTKAAATRALDALAAGGGGDTVFTAADAALLDALAGAGALGPGAPRGPGEREARARLEEAVTAYHRRQAALPPQVLAPALAEGTPADQPLLLRGDHDSRGDPVPRRLPRALDGRPYGGPGSGRLALAHRLTAPDNPLVTRVAVNRVWHHLLGRGLVTTVDNLGVQGRPPTHPGLLDWLAARFRWDGWSVKTLIRRIVTSRTYRLASTRTPEGEARDPRNLLLHRAHVHRLEGEALRDAILAVSGSLDPGMFGPGVPVHLTPFMTGRGRPESGPLDGHGRRSIYLQIRRNFLSPWLRAFDLPTPFATVGRRGRTNVPAQALALLNDPFVAREAGRWARRELAVPARTPVQTVRAMARRALARRARPEEVALYLDFLREQASARGGSLDDPRPWGDLAHALFNVTEFTHRH